MPWSAEQRAAIAAKKRREGASPEEIRDFFHKHGHGGDKGKLKKKLRGRKPR